MSGVPRPKKRHADQCGHGCLGKNSEARFVEFLRYCEYIIPKVDLRIASIVACGAEDLTEHTRIAEKGSEKVACRRPSFWMI